MTCNMAREKKPLWRRITHTTGLRIENKHVIHVFRYVKIDERVKWFFLNVHSYNSRKLTDYLKCLNFHFITFRFMIKDKQELSNCSRIQLPQGRTYNFCLLWCKKKHSRDFFIYFFFASTLTQFYDGVWN